jgi:hypothetical protein
VDLDVPGEELEETEVEEDMWEEEGELLRLEFAEDGSVRREVASPPK